MTDVTYTIPELRTDRLVLRAPSLADLPAFCAFFTTERSHIVGGPLDERAAHRSMMANFGSWALRGFGLWHIADPDTDELLGWTGIIYGPGWSEPELGWSVLEGAEGKGIAFEAAKAARAHAAAHLNVDAPISYIDPSNDRSIALAERLGATHERDEDLLGHSCRVYRHPKVAA